MLDAAKEAVDGAAARCRDRVSTAAGRSSNDPSSDPSQWTDQQLRAYLKYAPGTSATSVQTREQLIRRACRTMGREDARTLATWNNASGTKAAARVDKENTDSRAPAMEAKDSDEVALFKAMAAPVPGLRPRDPPSPPRAASARGGADEMLWPELPTSNPAAARDAGGAAAAKSHGTSRNPQSRPLPSASAAAAPTTKASQTERNGAHRRRHRRPQQARPQSARPPSEAPVPPLSLEAQLGMQLELAPPPPSHRSLEEPMGLSQRTWAPPVPSSRKKTGAATKTDAAAPEGPSTRVEAWAKGKDFRAMVSTLEEARAARVAGQSHVRLILTLAFSPYGRWAGYGCVWLRHSCRATPSRRSSKRPSKRRASNCTPTGCTGCPRRSFMTSRRRCDG